jgi:hypothetical protein
MSTILGLTPSDVALAANIPKFTVGQLGETQTSDGTKQFLYVHASEAITAAGYLCIVNSAGEAEMLDDTSSASGTGTGMRVGAAMAAIANNDWFWIQVYGKGSARTLADAAKGTQLTSSSTAGAVDDATTGGLDVINGLALGTTTGGAPATNPDAYFNHPQVGAEL